MMNINERRMIKSTSDRIKGTFSEISATLLDRISMSATMVPLMLMAIEGLRCGF